jgi:hypothetical protein
MTDEIPHIDDIESVPVSRPVRPVLKEAKGKIKDIAKLALPSRSGFRKFLGALKRTVTRKNKAGKIISHVVVAAGSILLGAKAPALLSALQPFIHLLQPQPQPINTHIMFHFNLLSLILIISSGLLGYAVKHIKTKGIIKNVITDIDAIVEQMRQARAPDSPKGQKVTPAEREATIRVAETKAIELGKQLFRRFFGSDDKKTQPHKSAQ